MRINFIPHFIFTLRSIDTFCRGLVRFRFQLTETSGQSITLKNVNKDIKYGEYGDKRHSFYLYWSWWFAQTGNNSEWIHRFIAWQCPISNIHSMEHSFNHQSVCSAYCFLFNRCSPRLYQCFNQTMYGALH